MAGVVGPGAMAGRLATAPDDGGNGAGAKIAQTKELLQELGTLGLQRRKRVRHGSLLSERIYTLRNIAQKRRLVNP